jgi:hypothetical protein
MDVTHTHHHEGQALRHSHPGGNYAHGYFEHPEDGSRATGVTSTVPLADALAVVDRMQAEGGEDLAGFRQAWLGSGGPLDSELAALRELAETARQHLTATPELQCSGTVTTGSYVNSVSTAEDYARYAAAAMNAATADDTEFIADGATVTAYVHCRAHVSATFTLDEGRPYPGRKS